MASLREIVKHRILDTFTNVQAERKIIVLDRETVRIVDSVCMMNELLDTGAFLIEFISKRRQPYPTMQAIYFLSPNSDTISALIEDWRRKSYREAFLYFSTEVPQEQFDQIARSPVGANVKAFQELFVNLIAFESRAFHLDFAPESTLSAFFGPREQASEYERAAGKLISACVSLNMLPRVRYHKSDLDKTSAKLAILVQEQLDRFGERNAEWRKSCNTSGELLVMDRTVDLISPLLHEFTYQAMAQDLLPINDGNRYEYKYGEATKTVALDENDSLWVAMRHTHIAQCSQLIIQKFNQFAQDNRVKAHGGGPSSSGTVTNLSELRDMMGSLGEFQELKAQYSLHLTIAQECMNVFERKKLVEVSDVEQDMATGLDSSGDPVQQRGLWARIAPILGSPSMTSADRARIIGLYLLTANVSDTDKQAVYSAAGVDPVHTKALHSLVSLGHEIPRAGVRVARKKEIEDAPFDSSRYITEVKRIIQEAVSSGGLSQDLFPYVKPQTGAASGQTPSKAAPLSLRAKGPEDGHPTSSPTKDAPSTSDRPVLAFIIGGMTYSEVRSVYEVSAASKRDCFIGSTHILLPEAFLQGLSTL